MTHQRISDEQLIQNSKLSALGSMISGIAHEINNPNTLISMNTPILKEYWKLFKPILSGISDKSIKIGTMKYTEIIEDMDRLIETLECGSRRISKIVESLKEFASDNKDESYNYYSVNEIIEKAYLICGASVRRKVQKIEFDLEKKLSKIFCCSTKIQQAVINILLNAADAVDCKTDGLVKISCYNKDDESVIIKIANNGPHIPDDIKPRIFEPFFTTKKQSNSGLGLSIAWGIIKEHKGELIVNSEAGCFTEFEIQLNN